MKIILSRKGFDSSSGGCPNPVFPDGSLLALPIPDARSGIRYRDIALENGNMGNLVSQLTRGKIKASRGAHLDPDIVPDAYPRNEKWRPLFGQKGSAQGHLARQGVGSGDLFLFFGLFREVEKVNSRWKFRSDSAPHHRIWGWFQVAEHHAVARLPRQVKTWADYHPHCRYPPETNNHLYIARKTLSIPGHSSNEAGSGCFRSIDNTLALSDSDARLASQWKLPVWFFPSNGKTPLSYHSNPGRWRMGSGACHLSAASRGQEFVLPCSEYPEALAWARGLIANRTG